MRTDVKLGLIGSLVVVVLVGLYLTGRGESKPDIPVQQKVEKKPESPPPTSLAQRPQGQPQGHAPARPQRRPTTAPPRPQTATPARRDDSAGEAGRAFTGMMDSRREKEDVIESVGGPAAGTQLDTKEEPVEAPSGTRTTAAPPVEDAARGSDASPPPAAPTRSVTAPVRPQPEPPPVAKRVETHTVKEGETIQQLAQWYYGNASHARLILQANPQITNPTAIPAGTRLVIPDSPGPEVVTARRADSPPGAASPGSAPAAGGRSYTVREGDSLYAIAQNQLGSGPRWKEIYELNKSFIGSDPARLKVGTALRLPSP